MKRDDKNKIASLYENAVYIAKISDLSPELSVQPADKMITDPQVTEKDSEEVSMAKADLMQTVKHIQSLMSILDNVQNLEGWVAAKITLAADYISSVTGYLEYKQSEEGCGCDDKF